MDCVFKDSYVDMIWETSFTRTRRLLVLIQQSDVMIEKEVEAMEAIC